MEHPGSDPVVGHFRPNLLARSLCGFEILGALCTQHAVATSRVALEYVVEVGCDHAPGYHLGRPMPGDFDADLRRA